MSRHLKNIVILGLKATCASFVTLPPNATPHTKGVRYLHLADGMTTLSGAMDLIELGRQRRKRIIVRPSRFRKGLHELYTYHFPTHWSAACVANRELIKEAQRQAHALEHDYSPEAIEWRIRFFKHYFRVVKGGAQPEPGFKRYARFYQYAYVAIYRQLKAEQAAQQAQEQSAQQTPQPFALPASDEDITFDPVVFRPLRARRSNPMQRVLYARRYAEEPLPPVPL